MLTASQDAGAAFAGTAGNDTFVAADANASIVFAFNNNGSSVFNVGDDINGGAGTDTLKIYGDASLGNVQLAKIAGIENVELTSNTVEQTETNLRGLSGLSQVTVKGGGGINALLGSSAAVTAAIDGTMTARPKDWLDFNGVTITYGQADSTADSATLKLNAAVRAAVPAAAAIEVTVANAADGEIETLNIVNTGTSRIKLLSDHTAIVASAEGSLRIDAVTNTLESFDASASKGNVRANLTNKAAGELDVVLGAGADRIDVANGAFTNARSSFAGGEGTDTLMLNTSFDNTTAAGAGTQRSSLERATGFEIFGVTDLDKNTLSEAKINLANTAFAQFRFENTGGATLTQVENTDSFTVAADIGTVNSTMKTGQSTLNLAMTTATDGSRIDYLDTKGAKVLNVSSGAVGVVKDANEITFIDNATTTNFTVNLTGAHDLTIGGLSSSATVDGTAATGDLVINGSEEIDIISTGAGDDVLRGGLGADTLAGGEGNDTFEIAFGVTMSAAAPAVAEIHDLIRVTPSSFVAGAGAVNAVNINGTVKLFTAGATVAQTAAAIEAAIGDDNITVTAINANLLRVTDASGAQITALDLRTDAAPEVPATPAPTPVTAILAGNAAVPVIVPSVTDIVFPDVATVTGTKSFSLDGGLNFIAALGATSLKAAAIATGLGAGYTVTALSDGLTIRIVKAAGTGINESNIIGYSATAATPPVPADMTAAAAIEVAKGAPVTTAALSTYAFDIGDSNNVSNIKITIGTETLDVDLLTTDDTDAEVIAALNLAYGSSIFSDAVPLNATDGLISISVPFGTVVSTSALVTALAPTTPQVDGTLGNGATSVEVQDGSVKVDAGGVTAPESTSAAPDTIVDFTLGSDLISLLDVNAPAILRVQDVADNAASPVTGAYFAGSIKAGSLTAALTLALTDANGSVTGAPVLKDGNAVLFVYADNTYVYVDNNDHVVGGAFNSGDANNILIKMTGVLDLTEGTVSPTLIFA